MAGNRKSMKGNPLMTFLLTGGLILVALGGIAYIVVPQIGEYIDFGGGDTIYTGGGGTGDSTAIGSNIWDARGSIDIHAPDINMTVEDARWTLTETAVNPGGADNIDVYAFTENPFNLAPSGAFYSDYDRLRLLVSESKFITGTSRVDLSANNLEVLDGSILTNIIKSPATFNETDGKIYFLLTDNDFVDGTPGTLINGFPVVLEVDLRNVPAYRADATAEDYHLNFGATMAGISHVYPEDAGGASVAWRTKTAGWPELGSATVTLPTANVPSDLNSTADNYQGAQITLGNGGVFFWRDLELIVRVDANQTTQSFNKFQLDGEDIGDVKSGAIGGITYYFIKIPRSEAVEGNVLKLTAYYETTETTTTVDYIPFIGEWNTMNVQQMITSSSARIADLDTTAVTSSVHCP